MDREIAEFFVKFTSEGLEEVKDSIDDLSKKMDDVGKSAERASRGSDGFFANIGEGGKWLLALTTFTSAVMSLKVAWDAVANAASSTMTIYNQAMLAGTDPKTMERWQNVARHHGLNPAEIFSDFRNGRAFLTRFQDLEIGEEFNKTFARAGLNSDAVIASIERGNMDELFRMLNTALSARDASGNALVNETRAKDVLSQIGFGDTMLSLLRLQTLPQELANARLIYTDDPEKYRASYEFTDAQETLRDTWKSIWADPKILDSLTELLHLLNDTVMPTLTGFFTWLFEKIGDILTTSGDTPEEKQLGNALKVVAAAAGGAVGGVVGAGVGAGVADWAHDKLLKYDWYKNWANRIGAGAPTGYWKDYDTAYQNMLLAADAGSVPSYIEAPTANSNATAVVNINDVEVARETGNGYTAVNMSLPQTPEWNK